MKNKKQWHPSGLDTGGVMCPKETERRHRSTRQVFKSHSKIHKKQQNKILLSTEADPPPAYSRRASEAEPAPADCPPSYTRARWSVQRFRFYLYKLPGHYRRGMNLAAGQHPWSWSRWQGMQRRLKVAVKDCHRATWIQMYLASHPLTTIVFRSVHDCRGLNLFSCPEQLNRTYSMSVCPSLGHH